MNFNHSVTPLLLFTMMLTLVLSGCSGAGGGDDGSLSQDASDSGNNVQISSELYGSNPSFKSGQIFLIDLKAPLAEGEQLLASDSAGNDVTVVGVANGNGLVLLPSGITPGPYTIKMMVNGVEETLDFNIDPVVLPADSIVYLSDFIDQLVSWMESYIQTQGVSVDPLLSESLVNLKSLHSDLGSMSQAEIEELANFIYVNMNGLNSFMKVNAMMSKIATPYAINILDCTSEMKSFTAAGILTVGTIGLIIPAITSTVATGPFSAILAPVTAVVGFAGAVAFTVDWIEKTEALLDCTFVPSNSILDSGIYSSGKLALMSTDSVAGIKSFASTTGGGITYSDGETKSLHYIVNAVPTAEVQSVIDKVQSMINSVSALVPNNILSTVNNIDATREKDLTSGATLSVSSNDVSCSGPNNAFTCAIVSGASLEQIINFSLTVFHPALDAVETFDATISGYDISTLLGRLPVTPRGTDYQAYYNPASNLTWYAGTSESNTCLGTSSLAAAQSIAATLVVNGVAGWRLPTTLLSDTSCSNYKPDKPSGYNCIGSEMGNLFYNVLGNSAEVLISNTGPFSSIESEYYWTPTENVDMTNMVYQFNMGFGSQGFGYKNTVFTRCTWPVRAGDVGVIP